tara:strand:- start:101 stop:598 length:498 start_codon:yes stop_codon:yes gene_type:complete
MQERPVKVSSTVKSAWWDTTKTDLIYSVDLPYVRNIVLNYSSDSLVEKCEWVLNAPRYKPEFKCELCGAGNSSKGHRPACFYPTEVGYVYKCLACEPSLSLYQFLLQRNPKVALNYQMERWHKKLTGRCYNCPEPPKNLKREHYAKLEKEAKERNQRAYKERHNN